MDFDFNRRCDQFPVGACGGVRPRPKISRPALRVPQ
jgi:hypothetical protein